MSKILMVAGMINTLNFFRPLAARLKELGHEAELVLGQCGPSIDEGRLLEEKISGADGEFTLIPVRYHRGSRNLRV